MPELPTPADPVASALPATNRTDHAALQDGRDAPRHVFVYGTLRRGSVRDINHLKPTPRFVGWARVAGRLFHLGAYPGLLLDAGVESARQGGGENRWVLGEVYAIAPGLERVLDAIEEVWPQASGEYAKRQVSVYLLPAGSVRAGWEDQSNAGSDSWKTAICQETVPCLLYEIAPNRARGRPCLRSGDWMSA